MDKKMKIASILFYLGFLVSNFVLVRSRTLLQDAPAAAASASAPAAASASAPGGSVPAGGVIDIVATCGAKENADVTEALTKAWADACACTTPSTVMVPAGVFNLGEICFVGPCKAPITFQLDGTLKAPVDAKTFKKPQWIVFDTVEYLTVTGTGTFDGQGAQAWASSGCEQKSECSSMPISIRLDRIKHTLITGVTSQDSKNFNVNLLLCENVTFDKFKVVTAPGSLNTDGIHMGRSSNIKITDTNFVTGDDCISIGDGTANVEISKVTCGPGHGISIGSLGKYQKEDPVTAVHVKDCTISNSDNGARLKAWPGLYPNTVDDILFEGITMNNVSNPIILDMCYCPHGKCKESEPSLVKMSNVVFRNIKGSSACPEAVQISCSPGMCENIELCDVDLTYDGPKMENFSTTCKNVKPKITPPLKPEGPTCC